MQQAKRMVELDGGAHELPPPPNRCTCLEWSPPDLAYRCVINGEVVGLIAVQAPLGRAFYCLSTECACTCGCAQLSGTGLTP